MESWALSEHWVRLARPSEREDLHSRSDAQTQSPCWGSLLQHLVSRLLACGVGNQWTAQNPERHAHYPFPSVHWATSVVDILKNSNRGNTLKAYEVFKTVTLALHCELGECLLLWDISAVVATSNPSACQVLQDRTEETKELITERNGRNNDTPTEKWQETSGRLIQQGTEHSHLHFFTLQTLGKERILNYFLVSCFSSSLRVKEQRLCFLN